MCGGTHKGVMWLQERVKERTGSVGGEAGKGGRSQMTKPFKCLEKELEKNRNKFVTPPSKKKKCSCSPMAQRQEEPQRSCKNDPGELQGGGKTVG